MHGSYAVGAPPPETGWQWQCVDRCRQTRLHHPHLLTLPHAAWQTGVTLENIPIRLDALEYLQLPFRLTVGHIGRLQLQIPWQALRSPLILEVADARLEACLREPGDLWQEPAQARAWAGKEARLAGVEASALAGPEGVQEGGAGPSPSQGSAGLLWGALSSLASFLVNRLQIRLTNVCLVLRVSAGSDCRHEQGACDCSCRACARSMLPLWHPRQPPPAPAYRAVPQDPASGQGMEVRLPSVHTCSPSVALRMLGAALDEALGQEADDPGMVHKDVALAAVSVWLLRGEAAAGAGGGGFGADGAKVSGAGANGARLPRVGVDGDSPAFASPSLGPLPLLPPCDGVLHLGTTAALHNGTLRADCTLTLPSLRLSLSDEALAGVFQLADSAEHVSRQNRAALFCPLAWRLGSGHRKGFARWVDAGLRNVVRCGPDLAVHACLL